MLKAFCLVLCVIILSLSTCTQKVLKCVFNCTNYFSNPTVTNPANRRCWHNDGLLPVHRLRRWPNIKPALGQRLLDIISSPTKFYGVIKCVLEVQAYDGYFMMSSSVRNKIRGGGGILGKNILPDHYLNAGPASTMMASVLTELLAIPCFQAAATLVKMPRNPTLSRPPAGPDTPFSSLVRIVYLPPPLKDPWDWIRPVLIRYH